jgi:tRNA dimethylallyltransferase
MDIGTAKPSASDQMKIPHHLIDITTPDRPITVADFKQQAEHIISDISDRGKLPILVGGTGLYINSVIFNFQFRPIGNPKLRKRLSVMSVQALQNRLIEEDIPLPNNSLNPRHLIRSIESGGITALSQPLRPSTLIVGLMIDRPILTEKIMARVEKMFNEGLEIEVLSLVKTYGWVPPLQTIGYQEFQLYFAGQQSLDETKAKIIRNTLAYARRQRTWFKRNNSIRWITQQIEAVDIVTTFLNKKQL